MPPDLTAIEWVSVSSLSLGLAALVVRFLAKSDKVSARAHLLTAAVVLGILSAGVSTANTFRRSADIASLSEEIYMALGNQQKTTDQLLVEVGPQRETHLNAALAHLKRQRRVESEVEQVALRPGRPNAVRLWRALPTQ